MTRAICTLLLAAACGPAFGRGDADGMIASVTYVRPDGTQVGAFALSEDGVASVEHRGELLQAQLPATAVQRLRDRLAGERLGGLSQNQFDAAVVRGAEAYGLIVPIPAADDCRLRLPGGTLRCVGPAVLANRMSGVAAVQDYERLRGEFEQLAGVVILGGVETLHTFLRAAGEAAGAPIRLSDLSYADRFAGEIVAHFSGADGTVVVTSRDGVIETRVLATRPR